MLTTLFTRNTKYIHKCISDVHQTLARKRTRWALISIYGYVNKEYKWLPAPVLWSSPGDGCDLANDTHQKQMIAMEISQAHAYYQFKPQTYENAQKNLLNYVILFY